MAGVLTEAQVAFLLAARVARLATADAAARPHCVPVVFGWDGTDLLLPLDAKPKRVAVGRLRRVRNLEQNPRAVLLVDRWDEDWSRLAWLMVEGSARVTEATETDREILRARYPQYEAVAVTGVIRLHPERVLSWGTGTRFPLLPGG